MFNGKQLENTINLEKIIKKVKLKGSNDAKFKIKRVYKKILKYGYNMYSKWSRQPLFETA